METENTLDNYPQLNICRMKNTPTINTIGTLDNYQCENICGVKNSITTKTNMMKHLMLLMFTVMMFAAQAQNSVYKRTVQWNFGGYTFTDQLTFNYSDYMYYRGLSKTQAKSAYANEYSNHAYLMQLAKVLDEDAKDLGYTGFTMAEYLVAFVQQAIPYKSDPYNNGWDYPKYPIETLVEQGGDCEDKAALLVALLNTFGFDAVLVSLPGHMAAAISCSNCGGYYTHNGKKYSFIETTTGGWSIGTVPPESKYAGATILDVVDLQVYKRNDVFAYNGNNKVEETPHINNWDNNTKPNYNGGNVNVYSAGGTSTSTVTINGTTYQVKGSGSTTITVNGATVTIITQ